MTLRETPVAEGGAASSGIPQEVAVDPTQTVASGLQSMTRDEVDALVNAVGEREAPPIPIAAGAADRNVQAGATWVGTA